MFYKIVFTLSLLFLNGCDSTTDLEETTNQITESSEADDENSNSSLSTTEDSDRDDDEIVPTTNVSTEVATDREYQVIAWSDLGMHCMDGEDYSVFSILPPYSNLMAQVIKKGSEPKKISSGITLSYEAYSSLDGKLNTSSSDKTNFWDYVSSLFGSFLEDDMGLTGNPVQNLTPSNLKYNLATGLWEAIGIPTAPKNDDGTVNNYPMVKVVAKDTSGNIVGETTTVLPVSSEMDCKSCHNSISGDLEAKPQNGWENSGDEERDYKLNILKLHDDKHNISAYLEQLSNNGYDYSESLYETAKGSTPILCASCHKSSALGKSGFGDLPSLSSAIHSEHAHIVQDSGRNSCYKCHPGSETECLRGAMGSAKNSDGTYQMDCQSCHGSIEAVGSHNRENWVDEPDCQSCHHDGEREISAVTETTTGTLYSAVIGGSIDSRFATNSGKLFKESKGHGNLQCSACHGSTHAIYPSSQPEDNIQNERIQGYSGTLSNCSSCHNSMIYTASGGPHGMHQVGEDWVENHEDVAERSTASCQACHGTDYRGSKLSKMFETRVMERKTFEKGYQIGCYDCHDGPSGD